MVIATAVAVAAAGNARADDLGAAARPPVLPQPDASALPVARHTRADSDAASAAVGPLPVPIPTPPALPSLPSRSRSRLAAVAPAHPPRRARCRGKPRARRSPAPHCCTRAGRVRPAAEHRAPASPGALRRPPHPPRGPAAGHRALPYSRRAASVRPRPAREAARDGASHRRAQLRRVLAPLAACVATLGPRQERVIVRRAGLRGFEGASRAADGGETASHREARRSARAPRAAAPAPQGARRRV